MIKDGRAGMQLIQIMIVFGFGISSGGCDSRKDSNHFHDDVCAPQLRITLQHSTAQHSTVQYSTAQHSTAQHSTAQHNTACHQ